VRAAVSRRQTWTQSLARRRFPGRIVAGRGPRRQRQNSRISSSESVRVSAAVMAVQERQSGLVAAVSGPHGRAAPPATAYAVQPSSRGHALARESPGSAAVRTLPCAAPLALRRRPCRMAALPDYLLDSWACKIAGRHAPPINTARRPCHASRTVTVPRATRLPSRARHPARHRTRAPAGGLRFRVARSVAGPGEPSPSPALRCPEGCTATELGGGERHRVGISFASRPSLLGPPSFLVLLR
jgi:hypothetical protein